MRPTLSPGYPNDISTRHCRTDVCTKLIWRKVEINPYWMDIVQGLRNYRVKHTPVHTRSVMRSSVSAQLHSQGDGDPYIVWSYTTGRESSHDSTRAVVRKGFRSWVRPKYRSGYRESTRFQQDTAYAESTFYSHPPYVVMCPASPQAISYPLVAIEYRSRRERVTLMHILWIII